METLFVDQENVGIVSKKGSKGKAGKNNGVNSKPSVKPLQSSSVANIGAGGKEKTIEETYQKKTQLEHILLRPDTYVGSIEKHSQTLWVYEGQNLVCRNVTYVPGLYKIFDEILVNAADNKQRDPSMDSVKVNIDVAQNTISVYNNGDGVPVEIHGEEGVYVPELIFGHLLTSSNYDDSQKKTTGGRNGYGAKLANIFSTEFIIETADGRRGRRYKQVFRNNMGTKSDPTITTCKSSENWTKVTFKPDLAKFRMEILEDDVVALMSKRVLDVAGCLGKTVRVELNGQRLPIKSFQDYVGLYLDTVNKNREEPLPRIYERVNDRWEICVSLSDGQFQQVSFVNSIATIRGGTHVQYVTDQIANHVMGIVNKKNKNAGVKAFQIKNHMWVFVNSLIDNPAFDSQTKETLTTRPSSFGSKCELSQEFMKKVAKCGVVESILSWADFKQSKELKKNDGTKRQRVTGITKLDDANDAGGRYSEDCTLILTEGDSAKALAMSGISVVGRNRYGVFPLRGKLLNVREASHKQIMENQEINHIKQILGLQHGKEYTNAKSLRYGHLMIMTDQDHDGSHIKGLLINFIHSFWPSLLKIPSFLLEFITPIVKATHKNGKVLSFYTMPEYEAWKESLDGRTTGWSIKYYKGLGTSTAKEGKEYFRDIEKNKKDFAWEGDEDGDAIEMAFSKKKIDARKNWLRNFEPGTYLDQSVKIIKYSDFVNKELILFSMADLSRSIPSMVDGLKPGQRKILFCSFKRNFVTQAKVAQFSGYVSEHSAYHHGEQSLVSTIIGMAQNYVGSNNINLLSPLGQFGTRTQGGKDHASGRYIFTCLSPITRFLFPKDDDILLDYLKEDGQQIEPTWYCPILPMVLVNGSEGIGTGWSTFVPNYNPRDIVANIRRLLNEEALEPMDPWYKGFQGTIESTGSKESGKSYTISGVYEQVDDTTIRITELPVRKWTQDYKDFLESMMNPTDRSKEPFIRDYREHNTDTRVNFEVQLSEENMAISLAEGIPKKFKLTTIISTSNMHLFDAGGHIRKFESPEEILEAFFSIRLELYVRRKEIQLQNLELELLKLDNKVRFVLGVVRGEIIVNNRKRLELMMELKQKGFTPFPKKSKTTEPVVAGAENPDADESNESEDVGMGVRAGDYEYLLSMPIGTLTLEKVQSLCGERDKLEADVEDLKRATPKSLWLKDLEAFLKQLDAQELEEAKEEEYEMQYASKEGGKPGKRAPAKKAAAKAGANGTAQHKAPPKKAVTVKATAPVNVESDDEDLGLSLRERLAAYSKSTGAHVPEVEDSEKSFADGGDQVLLKGKLSKPGKTGGGGGRGRKMVVESDSETGSDSDDNSDWETEKPKKETKAVSRASNKLNPAGKKLTAATAHANPEDESGAPGAGKKRGKSSKAQAQKRVEHLAMEESSPAQKSPAQKVRRMRPSPFHKKSGSITAKLAAEEPQHQADNEDVIEEVVVPAPRRPKRANRTVVQYVISDDDDEDEDEEVAGESDEFSDFEADDSE
ncbi:hypothetical protein KP509_22G002000 [Ceratopteris richardii]|uniref:DNA topoisomerase 2 n=4 Tax=Ceratopteris richardii TaxID=49495 RepID=A0A8T2S4Q5_CERRI|nr:hypothetical protein KP509_22G002000 [Ceratopteris richardii]